MSIPPLIDVVPAARHLGSVVTQGIGAASESFASLLEYATRSESKNPAEVSAIATESPRRLRAQQALAHSLASPTGERLNLEELRAKAEQALSGLHGRIAARLEEAGIEFGGGFRLQISAEGALSVTGHPQREEIARTLEQDGPLAEGLRSVFATLDLVAAADGHRNFARAYESDPVAAVEQFRELFSNDPPSQSLVIDSLLIRPSHG